jgi:hypothetical protein
MGLLPKFSDEGLLPPGDYALTIDQLRASELVLGFGEPRDHPTWDAAWREHLVDNLATLASQLSQVGIRELFVDGSFVEAKDHPNDIDGYFECDPKRIASGDLQRELNLLDKHKIWTWDESLRRPYRGYPKKQLPMWHQYRVELYPHCGQVCGIKDANGNDQMFPAAFRTCRRNSRPKGIVRLNI